MKKLKNSFLQNKPYDTINRPKLKKSHLGWVIVGLLTVGSLSYIAPTVYAVGIPQNIVMPLSASNIGAWMSDNAEPTKNTGDYGSQGLENYVSKSNPWNNDVDLSNTTDLLQVTAKGIWGPDTKTGAKWYLDKAGTLHVGSGIGANNPENKSVWALIDIASKITKIKFEGKVTAPANSQSLFAALPNLKSVEGLNNFDISNTTKLSNLFSQDKQLTNVDVSSLNTSKVTDFDGMFKDAIALSVIDVSKFDTSSATTFESMFANTGVINIDLSNFDTTNVKNMSQMFQDTKNLRTISIKGPKWTNESLINTTYMFFGSAISDVDFSEFATPKLVRTDMMFSTMPKLKSLDLSKFDTSKVRSMDNMFSLTPQLKKIKFGKNFKLRSDIDPLPILENQTDDVKWRALGTSSDDNYPTGDYLSKDAKNDIKLTDKNLKPGETYILTAISKSFWTPGSDASTIKNTGTYGEAGLENYVSAIDPFSESIFVKDIDDAHLLKVKAKGIWGSDAKTGVKWYITEDGTLHLNNGIGANTSSRSPWVKYKSIIKNIVVEDNAVVQLPKISSFLFFDLDQLESIDLSNFDTSYVINMMYMFNGMNSLSKIKFGQNFEIPESNMPTLMQSSTKMWREIGSGTDDNPNGDYIDASSDNAITLTNNNIKTPGTYVLVKQSSSLWKPNGDSNTVRNVGTYGDVGLENYVYTSDPIKDEVLKSDISAGNLLKVKAKGIWGKDTKTGVKWYISEDNVLHLLGGIGVDQQMLLQSYDSPWSEYPYVVKIVVDGKVILPENSNGLFHFAPRNSNRVMVKQITGLEKFDTSKVKSMRSMFSILPELTTLSGLENWDVSKVQDFSLFLDNNKNMTDPIDLKSWDMTSVDNTSGMFHNLPKMTTFGDLSNWNLTNLQDASAMFSNDKSLNYLGDSIARWNLRMLSNGMSMFKNVSSLESLKGTEHWTIRVPGNLKSMFAGMTSLKELDVTNWVTSDITNMTDMLLDTKSLTQFKIGDSFKVSIDSDKVPKLGNQTDKLKWRGIGNGTKLRPKGIYVDSESNDLAFLTQDKIVNDETYVLAEKDETHLWTPSADADTVKNLGTYGDAGLENYVYASDPYQDEIDSDDVGTNKLLKVQAKGIWGRDTKEGSKWYITEDGVLHIGAGSLSPAYMLSDGRNISPLKPYSSMIKEIVLDGEVAAPSKSTFLFMGLENVKKIDLHQLDTSNVYDMTMMFKDLPVLESLDISTFNTSLVSAMTGMFEGDTFLRNLNVSSFDTSNVTDMSSMFSGMRMSGNIDVSNFNTSKVESMASMFSRTSIETADLTNFDTSRVDSMRDMFKGANGLSTVRVGSKFKVPSSIELQPMFHFEHTDMWREVGTSTNTLKPNGKILQNFDLEYAVLSPNELKTPGTYVRVPSVVSFWKPGSDSNTVNNVGTYGDSGLENYVYINDPARDEIFKVDAGTDKLLKVKAKGIWGNDVKTGVKWYITDDNVLYLLGGTGSDTIQDLIHSDYKTSPWVAFKDIIKKIVVDKNATVKLPPNSSMLFATLGNLESIENASNFDTSSVTNMEHMFNKASSLKSVDVSKWNMSNVTSISHMFFDTHNLSYLDVSNWDVSNVKSMSDAFSMMFNMKTIDVSNWDVSNVTDFQRVFAFSKGFEVLDFSSWDTTNGISMGNFFVGMQSLRKVTFGENFKILSDDGLYLDQTDSLKWREVGSGTDDEPNGEFIDGSTNNITLTNDNIKTPGTYVLSTYIQDYTITAVDETNSPVEGVEIELVDKDDKVIATAKTDATGKVVFKDIEIADYTVKQKAKDGYDTAESVKITYDKPDATMHLSTQVDKSQLPVTGSDSSLIVYSVIAALFASGLIYTTKRNKKDLD